MGRCLSFATGAEAETNLEWIRHALPLQDYKVHYDTDNDRYIIVTNKDAFGELLKERKKSKPKNKKCICEKRKR
jgi:hypothetical protein